MPNGLQLVEVPCIAIDIGQQGEVVASREAVHVGLQISTKCAVISGPVCQRGGVLLVGEQSNPVFFQDRRLGGQGAGRFVGRRQFARCDFAGLDVRLIEGVDAQQRAGDRGGDFPAEEFLAKVIAVGNRNPNDWLPGLLQEVNRRVLRRVSRAIGSQVDEQAILSP